MTTQTRKKRVFASVEESLAARVGLLDSLVKGLVPDADTSSVEGLRALGGSLGIAMPEQPGTLHSSGTPAGTSLSDQVDAKDGGGKQSTAAHAGKREEQMPVLRDQQGQMQYIGPASSYIFQIRMRAILAGRNSHCQSQGQFFLFANNATDNTWVGKVADLQREMSAGRAPSSREAEGESPAASDQSEDGDDDDSDGGDDGREESVRTEESLLSGTIPDRLVDAFFERIHPDFAVLSEDSFRRKYERFRRQKPPQLANSSGADVDASWVCSFLCVLILARRTVPPDENDLSTTHGQEAETRWWRKVQTLLPSVVFTSCISAVQALALAALHLNNTNNKDSCWTLTGAAVRIAIAIGLHRDATLQSQHDTNPVLMLRKYLWWTLYQFELMQAASLDRPSAIDDAACNISPALKPPANTGVDATTEYSTRLLRMLSQACRVVRTMNNNSSSASGESASDDSYKGPLSPAASLIRDMRRWRDNLPRELSQQAATMETSTYKQEAGHSSTMSPRSKRTLLLMHVQYHHILCVITRNPMLTSASRLFDSSNDDDDDRYHPNSLGVPEGGGGCNAFLTDVCIAAAQDSARLLFRLDAEGLFDQVTWWDFYFLYQAAQVLVLGVMYDARRGEIRRHDSPSTSTGAGGGGNSRLNRSRTLLHCCADLADRVARNPLVPGTIHRFAVVVSELVGLVEDFIARGPAAVEEGRVAAVTTAPPNAAATNVVPLSSSSLGFLTMLDQSGGDHRPRHGQQQHHHHHHQQHQYCHAVGPDSHTNNSHQASHMYIDGAAIATFEEGDGMRQGEVGCRDDLAMAGTSSDVQFPADMAAHFGFPDGSWTYREGQWNDFGSMVLGGGGYGP